MFGTPLLLLMCSPIGLSLVGAQVAVEEGEAEVTSDGHNANITCDDGFVVTLMDITFNGETYTLVNCVEGCGVFPVANGDDVPAGTLNGATVNITCGTGMEAVPDTATCLNGEWCVSNAICVQTCGELVVANGETVPAGLLHGETVDITCDAGYTPSAAQVQCDSGVLPAVSCGCGELIVANGTNIPAGTWIGTVVEIVCDAGLHSYYANATCTPEGFEPSRALCGNYPSNNDSAAIKYHADYLKVFDLPTTHNWLTSFNICTTNGGVLAPMISGHLMTILTTTNPIIPVAGGGGLHTAIGLLQKTLPPEVDVGWQWLNSAVYDWSDVVDIDVSNTVAVPWLSGSPDDADNVEDTDEDWGAIYNEPGNVGVIDHASYAAPLMSVLCQITYPWYEFSIAAAGMVMTSPNEFNMTVTDLEGCKNGCIENPFCRAFSFSAASLECRFHGIPPDDPEAVTEANANFDIFA